MSNEIIKRYFGRDKYIYRYTNTEDSFLIEVQSLFIYPCRFWKSKFQFKEYSKKINNLSVPEMRKIITEKINNLDVHIEYENKSSENDELSFELLFGKDRKIKLPIKPFGKEDLREDISKDPIGIALNKIMAKMSDINYDIGYLRADVESLMESKLSSIIYDINQIKMQLSFLSPKTIKKNPVYSLNNSNGNEERELLDQIKSPSSNIMLKATINKENSSKTFPEQNLKNTGSFNINKNQNQKKYNTVRDVHISKYPISSIQSNKRNDGVNQNNEIIPMAPYLGSTESEKNINQNNCILNNSNIYNSNIINENIYNSKDSNSNYSKIIEKQQFASFGTNSNNSNDPNLSNSCHVSSNKTVRENINLINDYKEFLAGHISKDKGVNANKIYSSANLRDDIKTLHDVIKDKKPIVVMIKTDHENIFGGYSSESINYSNSSGDDLEYKTDPNAFIFSSNKKIYKIKKEYANKAIGAGNSIAFAFGNDIIISDKFLTQDSTCNFPSYYEGNEISKAEINYGLTAFKIKELQIYQIIKET